MLSARHAGLTLCESNVGEAKRRECGENCNFFRFFVFTRGNVVYVCLSFAQHVAFVPSPLGCYTKQHNMYIKSTADADRKHLFCIFVRFSLRFFVCHSLKFFTIRATRFFMRSILLESSARSGEHTESPSQRGGEGEGVAKSTRGKTKGENFLRLVVVVVSFLRRTIYVDILSRHSFESPQLSFSFARHSLSLSGFSAHSSPDEI